MENVMYDPLLSPILCYCLYKLTRRSCSNGGQRILFGFFHIGPPEVGL